MTCVLYYQNSKALTMLSKVLLIALPVLVALVFAGLVIANIDIVRKEVVELFPSLENSMIFLFLVCIIIQGFIV